MWVFLSILGVVVLLGLIYLATLDGNFRVRRSRVINASPQVVFDKLRDFPSWSEWSPWVMHEPDCKLEFSDKPDEEGGYYTWDGKVIGAGKLTHVRLVPGEKLEEKIEFTRPFKSQSEVGFELEPSGQGTKVTWTMNGSMPFLFRFMVPKTVEMISKDYDLGLAMLGGVLDPSAEYPQFSFDGPQDFGPGKALCKAFSGTQETLSSTMETGFPQLVGHMASKNAQPTDVPFAAYYKADPVKKYFEGDMAIPVAEDIGEGDYPVKEFSKKRYYKVTVKGSYEFLELAWYAACGHLRMIKQKMDMSGVFYERYPNSPQEVSNTNELTTEIYIPIK